MVKAAKAKIATQDHADQVVESGVFRIVKVGLHFLKKKWHKLALYIFLFLAVAVLVNSAIGRLYDYWDVGSNSWFDRLTGDGEQFQRGFATVAQDQFDDRFLTVKYLKQGWKPADSMWFYNTTQGSDLLPYDFFLALEIPRTSEPPRGDKDMRCDR